MTRRPTEGIDPKREDAATAPRRRRNRAKPEPSEALLAEKPKALARALKRPIPPGIMFERDGDGYVETAPHSHGDLWELKLADAFGTRSTSVMRAFVNQLAALCSQAWDEPNGDWKPSEFEANAVLAMVADIQPRNIAEASLAAQMAAVHLLTMRLAAQALNRGHMVFDREAALTGKLARTYAMQLETLQSLRGKRRSTRQTIKVSRENHIHYHDHREGQENAGQPREPRADTIEGSASVPRQEPGGKVLRLPSRARPRGV